MENPRSQTAPAGKKAPRFDNRTDPVKNFERWKKKYSKKQQKCKNLRKERRKPEWQVERESISRLVQRYTEINLDTIIKFSDFPLSKKSLRGLQDAQYRLPTEIQKQTIGLALQGKDVLGAAKTGSGKTLAFIIPALECLNRQQWTADDGLGVLIISPTRELAYQTFEVLRKVGRNHEFSAGLIIGGKDLKQESASIQRTNVLICTPGRLLQHMDETSFFYTSNLQMLILDEADRILDMGFADTMNAIIENLPKQHQTLLFSATQTKSVKDLARLSLKDPEYVWVHDKAKFSTPATLEQNYVVCELPQKINMLYSFIRNHLKKKSIVFFSSCKEVQYLFRVFCRLRPGITILALHGKQQQIKRMEVYNDYIRKKSAVLFATDIAARGLDFPAVNWVLQLDCPEDANTYIHRVGRTARYKEGGEALLVLLPSEEKAMVKQLAERKVPINAIKINPEKLVEVQTRLEAFLAQEQELKERAQRCFVSYLRSVYLMKNKEVFDVFKLPLVKYALSLGLAIAPRVRFLQKAQTRRSAVRGPDKEDVSEVKKLSKASSSVSDDEVEEFRSCLGLKKSTDQIHCGQSEAVVISPDQFSDEEESEELENDSDEEAIERSVDNATQKEILSLLPFGDDDDDDDDDSRDLDLLTVKRKDVFGLEDVDHSLLSEDDESSLKPKKSERITKIKSAKKVLKKNFKVNTKIKFTDDGKLIQQWPQLQKPAMNDAEEHDDSNGINLNKAKERLHEEDKFDKEEYRRKVKEKHREKRLKEKASRRANSKKPEEEEEEAVAYLERGESEEEVDLSALPDPDKHHDSDQEAMENEKDENDSEPARKDVKRKRPVAGGGSSQARGEADPTSKRRKGGRCPEPPALPLDTGLSLAEDEELVLHLLSSRS